MAQKGFIDEGINRVILATDGDFNVGQSSTDALVELIEQKRDRGVSLSTLGFGSGNYNDHLMEQLANNGNGSYSYIDTLLEARKVLVDELDSQLITVAADVKLQLEFNPQHVAEYRLIGYENRTLAREDFNNDQVDAGEIGAGHTVTAIYEITLTASQNRSLPPLRYQQQQTEPVADSDELAFMRIRYKQPGQSVSQLIESPLKLSELNSDSEPSNQDSQFTAAVIAFADKLQGGKYTSQFSYDDIQALILAGKGHDKNGLRAEFGRLVKLAQTLDMTES
jgi:Ca-activated chloride channel family protein